jgi:hypothetical protein
MEYKTVGGTDTDLVQVERPYMSAHMKMDEGGGRSRRSKRKLYTPRKYFQGLSRKKRTRRLKEIRRFGSKSWKNAKAYTGFATNKGVKTRRSKYTTAWKGRFPKASSLAEKAAATGVPLTYIRQCYNRGMAAWRTGHRPGATQQQWGYARVNSFLLCGKTYSTTDSDLARKAKASSAAARRWWASKC